MNKTNSIPGFPGVTILAIAEAVVKILESKSSDESGLIDTKATAEILHVSKQTIYVWVKEGKLKPLRIGKKFLYRKEEVLALGQQTSFQTAA